MLPISKFKLGMQMGCDRKKKSEIKIINAQQQNCYKLNELLLPMRTFQPK